MAKFELRIDADLKQAEKLSDKLTPRRIARPASRAMNRTITTVRKETAPVIYDQVGASTGISKSGIKRSMRLKKATVRQLVASVTLTGKPLPLIVFRARQVTTGVSHKAYGKKGLARGAFIARGVTTSGGKDSRTGKQVFIRTKQAKRLTKRGRYAGTGIKRTPIRKLWGPSLPQTFLKKDVVKLMDNLGAHYWPAYFQHELTYYLSKL